MMVGRVEEILTYADFFGQGINLTINKMTKAKTIFGGILSILLVIMVSFLFFFYAEDLLYRQNPLTSNELQMMKKFPNITLDKFSFPFSVSLLNKENEMIYKPKYFKYQFNYIYGDTSNSQLNSLPLKVKNCGSDDFPLISNEQFENLNLNNTLCIENQNLTISGSMTEKSISFISIKISICLNITEEDQCAPMQEIEEFIFSGTYSWKIYYQDTNISPHDLNEPTSYVMRNYYKLIKLGSYKIVEFFIRQQTLKSDEGFMFKSQSFYDSIGFDTDKFDDGSFDESTYDLIEFKILASPNKFNIQRSYLKIQTVLASVGGLTSLLKILFTLLSLKFSEMKRNEILLNKIFDFDVRTEIQSENYCKSELKRKLRKIKDEHKKTVEEEYQDDLKFTKNLELTFKNDTGNNKNFTILTKEQCTDANQSPRYLSSNYSSNKIVFNSNSNLPSCRSEKNETDEKSMLKKSTNYRNSSPANKIDFAELEQSKNLPENFPSLENSKPKNNLKLPRCLTSNDLNARRSLISSKFQNNRRVSRIFESPSKKNKRNSLIDFAFKNQMSSNKCYLNELKSKKPYQEKTILSSNSSLGINNSPSSKSLLRRIQIRDKQRTLNFSFVEIANLVFCFKFCKNHTLLKKQKLYEKSQNTILEFMDISFIIQKLEEFEKMKLVSFNSEQLALFNFLNKELISLNQEKSEGYIMNKLKNFNKNKENLIEIILKFKEKIIKAEKIEEIDKRLFSLILDEFKN
jgi:hypothetical protein